MEKFDKSQRRIKFIRELNSNIENKMDKYNYCLSRYENDVSIDLRSITNFGFFNIGFDVFHRESSDLWKSAYINVIKSVIDSITAQLANEKVRPYFNSIRGDYQTKQILRQCQSYFDVTFDKFKVHEKIREAFRSGCIFGVGYIWINPITLQIENLPTWTVSTLTAEERANKKTKLLVKYKNYPSWFLEGYKGKDSYVDYAIFVDTQEHEVVEYIQGKIYKIHKYEADVLPIVELYFNKPILGGTTVSVVEELDGIQTQIDLINAKLSACAQLTPANTTYVMDGSNLKPMDITSETGKVYGISMPPGTNAPPVVNVAPAPNDPSWQSELQFYISQAYEIVGVSQLSAQSKKPSGLDSGTALQTMEDIESDRFQTQLSNYINAYMDLAKVMIDVIPQDKDIIENSKYTSSYTWKDVKKQSSIFKIQYSAQTALSKDPSEKIKELINMSQIGLIGRDKIASYSDLPDLEDAYSGAQAVSNGIAKVIELAIKEDKIEIPTFVAYQTLAKEITITQNQLYSGMCGNDSKDKEIKESLKRLKKLEDKLQEEMMNNGFIETESQETQIADNGMASSDGMSVPNISDTIPNNNESVNTVGVSTDVPNQVEVHPQNTEDVGIHQNNENKGTDNDIIQGY